MDPFLCLDLASECGLLVHDALTVPGFPFELRIAVDSETGESIAWWCNALGERLGPAEIGLA
jgi:hypothetical protein